MTRYASRPTVQKEYEPGQAPWDTWSRDELLLEVRRMYDALISAHTALRLAANAGGRVGFWGRSGTGGEAVRKTTAVIDHYRPSDEAIYRAYFRMRSNLLLGVGYRWLICPNGHTLAGEDAPAICTLCHAGPMRLMTWEDLGDELMPGPEEV